jgi:hypothetical protein
MTTLIDGSQLLAIAYGNLVTKAAQNLPQTATANLFTVAGGNVLVTGLIGEVTTVIGATATSLSLGVTPTTGTANSTGLATATAITSKEAGTFVGLLNSSGVGGGLVVGANAGQGLFVPLPIIVAPGTITWTTSASTTGQMKWYLTYIPLDSGASVS